MSTIKPRYTGGTFVQTSDSSDTGNNPTTHSGERPQLSSYNVEAKLGAAPGPGLSTIDSNMQKVVDDLAKQLVQDLEQTPEGQQLLDAMLHAVNNSASTAGPTPPVTTHPPPDATRPGKSQPVPLTAPSTDTTLLGDDATQPNPFDVAGSKQTQSKPALSQPFNTASPSLGAEGTQGPAAPTTQANKPARAKVLLNARVASDLSRLMVDLVDLETLSKN